METKIFDALSEKYSGVKESILRRVAAKLAKTVTSEDDITTAVDGAFTDVLEAYGDQRATDAQKTAVANYERKHNLKDGKAINGGEPDNNEPDNTTADDTPAWAKQLLEENKKLTERLNKMDGERTTKTRKSIIDEIIKPLTESGRKAYQHIALGSMSEEDFTALQETIKGEVQELVNEQSARGAVFGRPASTGKQNTGKASEQEAKEFLKLMGNK